MRLWITGVGIVSALAIGARATMQRVCEGQRGIGPITLFDASAQRTQLAAQVQDLDLAAVLPASARSRWSRADAMAVLAAREALNEAQLDPLRDGLDLIVGGTTGSTFEMEERLANMAGQRPTLEALTPDVSHPIALVTDHVCEALGPFGRARTLTSACSTGAMALLLAAAWLRTGRSQRVLAGAADALCRLTHTGFNALGSLAPEPCRPFDRNRAGLTLGEGAAFLVIERDDVARARGAQPIAELVGWSAGAEAHHITNPEPEGRTPARLMRRAMSVAGLTPNDIDYVNAHGTATVLNDRMEIQALRTALGEDFERVAVSSTKGQLGHTLGAAGAIEAAITALSIQQQRVPPTGGLTQVGDDCQAHHVLQTAQDREVRAAISNSFGFGGLDAVVVMARPGFAPQPSQMPARSASVAAAASLSHEGLHLPAEVCARLEDEPAGAPTAIDIELGSLVDAGRGRRLGRAERMLTVACGKALEHLGGLEALGASTELGLVVGKPSGNLEAAAKFLRRAKDKGPRYAAPAEFPNLMLSATVGHTSIYHGLQGPALSVADRGISGLAAVLTAVEIVEAGIVSALATGGVDEWDLPAQCEGQPRARSESAACAVLSGASVAGAARVLATASWQDEASRRHALDALPSATSETFVLLDGPAQALAGSGWQHVPCVDYTRRWGVNEAAAVVAFVAAVGCVQARRYRQVLVISERNDRGVALLVGS